MDFARSDRIVGPMSPNERRVSWLSDVELLEEIIGTGDRKTGRSAKELACTILQEFGSLSDVARASHKTLSKVGNLSVQKSRRLKALFEFGLRAGFTPPRVGRDFRGPKEVFSAYADFFRDAQQETLLVLLLDRRGRWLEDRILATGTRNEVPVDPKSIAEAMICPKADKVILLHNHPSGDPRPSRSDIKSTRYLMELFEDIGLSLVDHVIISDGQHYSFAENRLLGLSLGPISREAMGNRRVIQRSCSM